MTPLLRHCSNCKRPLRVRSLAGHYGKPVEIDTCDRCCLIWFDETESVRLAGPGVADLVRVIHTAMSGADIHPHAASLARVQTCPVCGAELKPVANTSRYGRTAQLQCPHHHGYYQTYMLYLAEKGFIRPLAWADIRQLTAAGKELFCAACGASMPARPHHACPYCQSAVGILDPARLASAIDPEAVAQLEAAPGGGQTAACANGAGVVSAPSQAGPAPPLRDQHRCQACGGPVDPSRDLRCPQCHAPVLRSDTADALAAAASVEAAVRRNYARQAPAVSRAKLRAASEAAATSGADTDPPPRWRSLKARHIASLIVFAAMLAVWRTNRPEHPPAQGFDEQAHLKRMGPEAPLLTFAGAFKPEPLACAPDATTRAEVKLHQLIISPAFDESPQPVASLGALRAAHLRARRAHQEWRSGIPYETLLQRHGSPLMLERDLPSGFMPRAALPPQVAAAAFCLPLGQIGPPVLEADGFHVVQVLDAR